MASNGSSGGGYGDELPYKVGLINYQNKYLTAEKFGFKVNASGIALKQKQLWNLELKSDFAVLRSCYKRYLAADKNGNVTCDSEEPGSDAEFTIETQQNGKWAFKSRAFNYYLGGTADALRCSGRDCNEEVQWSVQLAIHPQINLKGVQNNRYAHLDNGRLKVNEVIPWGSDATITLCYNQWEENKPPYHLKASNQKYLDHTSGDLVDSIGPNTALVLEFYQGQVAFRNEDGCYLAASGVRELKTKGKMKTTPGPDELFHIQDSAPQGVFHSLAGGKKKLVSHRQGVDVSAITCDDPEDREIFQLENIAGKWAIRTCEETYWELKSDGAIHKTGKNRNDPNCLFALEYFTEADKRERVCIKAPNDKYVMAKQSGHLFAKEDNSNAGDGSTTFCFELINRPILVLKNDHGFVSATKKGDKYECARAGYDVFKVTYDRENYAYHLHSEDGESKWGIAGNNDVIPGAPAAANFTFEFEGQTTVHIRCPNGNYLNGESNGLLTAAASEKGEKTLWEY